MTLAYRSIAALMGAMLILSVAFALLAISAGPSKENSEYARSDFVR